MSDKNPNVLTLDGLNDRQGESLLRLRRGYSKGAQRGTYHIGREQYAVVNDHGNAVGLFKKPPTQAQTAGLLKARVSPFARTIGKMSGKAGALGMFGVGSSMEESLGASDYLSDLLMDIMHPKKGARTWKMPPSRARIGNEDIVFYGGKKTGKDI